MTSASREVAVALWRGPALADLAFEPSLLGEIARLEELRLAATEERIGVLLDLGQHAEVIPELAVRASGPRNPWVVSRPRVER